MGSEKIKRRTIKKEVAKEIGPKTKVKTYTEKGIFHMDVPIKPNVALLNLLNAIDKAYKYAELKNMPTMLHIKTKDKKGNLITLTFPIATMGVKDGKPIYPYYEPAGRALHIASRFPRRTSPNIREIAGQYVSACQFKRELCTGGMESVAYPNVKIYVKTAGGMVHSTDIDVLHFAKNIKKNIYHMVPVEVTTCTDAIKHKVKCWGPVVDLIQSLANAGGAHVNVTPAVVYVHKTYKKNVPKSDHWTRKIEDILESAFPGCHHKILELRSAAVLRNAKCVYSKMDQVEHLSAALRNYALLPKKHHSSLTHHTLKHYDNLQMGEHRFYESTALRKTWLCQHIPYETKNDLTNKYKKFQKKGKFHALLRAFDELEIPVHAGRRHQEVYMRLDNIMHQMVKNLDLSQYRKI